MQIKQESTENDGDSYVKFEIQSLKTVIKQETVDDDNTMKVALKIEQDSSDNTNNSILTEKNYIERHSDVKVETPIKNDIRPDIFFEDSINPSPFNKELFRNFNLDQESPQTKDDAHHSLKVETRKSVKRTVFQRDSPYKRYSDESSGSQSRFSAGRILAKDRLGQKIDEDEPER